MQTEREMNKQTGKDKKILIDGYITREEEKYTGGSLKYNKIFID